MERLRTDGNAIAGLMREIFVHEMTASHGECAGCGAVEAMGAGHVYFAPHSPGAVLRCCHCESVLMVVVHGGGRYRLACSGLAWLELADVTD